MRKSGGEHARRTGAFGCGTLVAMPKGLLEVIAVDAEDARRAVDGGADRLELVSAMEFAGFCPSAETLEHVLSAVDVPIRVMLRAREGFGSGGSGALRELWKSAVELRKAGAEEFVMGWLDEQGAADIAALDVVGAALNGLPWTFHKAVDVAADRAALFDAVRGLRGLDTVLTSGGPFPAGQGAEVLAAEAAREAARADGLRLLVGGGLRIQDVPALRAAGLTDFHVGTAVRDGGSWSGAVQPGLVAQWRAAVYD